MRIVITHHNADLDALASLIAACKLHDGAVGVRGRAMSQPSKRYLALHKDRFPLQPYNSIVPADIEEVIIVDVRDQRRLTEYAEILAVAPRIVVYDHHPATPHDITADVEILEPVGACVTVLCERLQEQGITPDPAEATLMLLGIYADTGQLSFSSTTARDVEAAAFLLRAGAKLKIVNRYLQQEFTPGQRGLLVDMLARTSELSVSSVDIAVTHASAPRYVAGAAEAVERVMQLGGHDAIFGIIEFTKDHRVQVIARSKVPYVDVGELMSEIGGGGHAGAAAASFKGQSCEEITTMITDLVGQATLRPTRVRDLMSSPVQTVEHATTLARAQDLLGHWAISGVPVLRDGEMSGIVSRRDIERAGQAQDLNLPVSAFMSHEVVTIAADEPLEDALDLMTARDVGRLPVCDGGRLIGIVSRTDILKCLYGASVEPLQDS